MDLLNSEFDTNNTQAITPENASNLVSLLFQSKHHSVYRIKFNNKWMFLKRIIDSQKENPVYIQNLEKEFEIGFTLDHPGIVQYYNLGKDNQGYYIITEFIEGEMLRSLIAKGSINRKFINEFIDQILSVLEYLHDKGIYHLDLKPENIIISSKSKKLKLIDFGLAYSDSYSKNPSGTLTYASPEMFTSPESCNASSDIYSIGVILLELFTGSTDKSALNKVAYKYRKTISKCLELNQKDRIQSVPEFRKNIKRSNQRIVKFFSLFFLTFILSFTFYNNANFSENWQHFSELPEVRNAGRAVNYKEDIYYFGGSDAAFVRNTNWKYDQKKQKWFIKKSMPIACAEMGCANIGDFIYFFGGWEKDKGPTNKSFIYDIKKDIWDSLPNLPVQLTSVSAVSLNGDIYIQGGTLGETKSYFIKYNCKSKRYTILPTFQNSRMYVSLLVFNDNIYAIGGNSFKKGEYKWHNEVDKYITKNNSWIKLSPIPIPISRSSAIYYKDKIHLIGGSNLFGNDKEGIKNTTFIFDPKTNKWTSSSSLPKNICCHQTIIYQDKLMIIGGSNEFPNPTKEIFINN